MTEKTLHTGNASLYYTVAGSGAPVVFIHGFGEDGQIWKEFTEPFKPNFTIITPDLAGSGHSVGSIQGITIDALADQVKLILDSENIATCSMIGHSMGGYITLAFAEKYPFMLNRIGLFHSTAFADSEEKKQARRKNIAFIRQHGSAKFLQQSVPNLFSEETNEKNPSLVKKIISRYSGFSPDSLIHYTEAMMNRPERTEVLKNFLKPVLFIMGENDKAVPLAQNLKECHIPEVSYIYICAHSGHTGMLEEPEFCIKAVKYFLKGD